MGTSKGYIAPTTIHWSQAKRAVTNYLNKNSSESRANAAAKYAKAMKKDIAASGAFTSALGKIVSFANSVHSNGYENALQEIGREDLIEKSADEVFDELLGDFTGNGATKEDSLAAQAIGEALNILGIDDLENLADIPTEEFVLEILSEYVKYSFAFRYSEKIETGRTSAQANEILQDMEGYISNKIHLDFDREKLKNVDFRDISSSNIAEQLLIDALNTFEDNYGER